MPRSRPRIAVMVRVAALAMLLLIAGPAGRAVASSQLTSIIQDDPRLDADPAGTLARARVLGADAIRVAVPWNWIAPTPNARKAPRHFDAADPGAYPAGRWGLWDAIVLDAQQDGIRVDFDLMGGAPRWAIGSGRPAGHDTQNWEPSASAFGAFVHAIATRYSGSYVPVGQTRPLPRVDFWSVWNEPDYGPSLAPQGVPGHLSIENSPRMYRNLVDAAWRSLQATGHTTRTDTITFGELAPRGESDWGVFSGMKPLTFLRAMYCVDSRYHPLLGAAARIRGCPTTRSASRRFRAQNPALFQASGVSDHPYMRWYKPNHEPNPDPINQSPTADYSSLGVIGNLTGALDRLQRVYGSRTRFPIYNTEFGYITSPPKHSPDPTTGLKKVIYLSPVIAAGYMNWAEYISWRNPRIRSFEQYLIYDPLRPSPANNWGGFASGLLTWTGLQKPTYYAWRLPLYLPRTTARRGHSLEVWGCIRPAQFALADTGSPQTAQLQFARRNSASYTTLRTVTAGADSCYFDLRMTFPSSGKLRLAYTYPDGDQLLGDGASVISRTVSITVR